MSTPYNEIPMRRTFAAPYEQVIGAGAADQPGRNKQTATEVRVVVRVVVRLVGELFDLACQGDIPRVMAGRRQQCHVRQISMYLCHVVLSMNYGAIARAMGRDRTTVVHGCRVVEDRRDERAYDLFVERCERCVEAVFDNGDDNNDC